MPDPGFERRVLETFDAVLERPAGDREAELVRRCADEPELAAAVRRLLAAHGRAEWLPTTPPEPASAQAAAPPARVGAYRLAELIGRGGMGLVYRGERVEGGFEQTVAVKLMRGGLFSATAAEQFAVEQRILARLRHPHITRLFDGGLTPDGRSFIVMERVEGAPLLEHVAGLPPRERARLFLQVCAAVEHAHANGVVHADLKPGNVVVDRDAGVKVLDFGIAALVDAARQDAAGADGPRPRAHTARYASPQQQAGAAAEPGDDIFALGRLLEDLIPAADRELAAVVARATAASREGRYPTVRELAADVDRWLHRFPVHARTAGPVRRAGFFVRRHPWAMGSAAAAFAALVVALGVTTTLYVRSEERLAQVRGLSTYLLDDVTQALLRTPGTAQLRLEVAARGRAYLEALDAPTWRRDIRFEVARGYSRTGEALTQVGGHAVGDVAAGRADLARAEDDLRRLLERRPDDAAAELTLVRTLTARAAVLQNIDNDAPAASRVYAEACARAERLVRRRPDDADARFARLDCLSGRANLLNYEGRFREMPALLIPIVADYRALPADADPDLAAQGLARAYNLLGDARYFLGSPRDALATYRQAAAVLEAAQARRRDVRVLDMLAFTQFNIASTLQELGRAPEELAAIRRGVEVSDILGSFETSPRARHIDNIVRMQLAVALSDNGRHAEAIETARAALEARRAAARARPGDYNVARAVPVGLKPLGEIYLAAGSRREACEAYRSAIQSWRELQARVPLNDFDGGPELAEVEGKAKAACG